MAESTANIGVKVGGDISPLRAELKKGASLVDSFSKKARSGATEIAKYGLAAGAAAAGGLTLIYKQQSKVIDSLAKTADALNINIANLQALHHISELNGVSQESMNKSLQRMEMRLGEAARKGGAAADALEAVGVSIESITEQSPDQQMETLAKAIAGVENQSVKASIASDIFGREGLKMLKVLKALESEGLYPTRKELDALGVSLTRLDAAKVEAANDALFRVSQAVSAAGQAVTVELAPYVEEVANQFVEMAKDAGGFGSIAEKGFGEAAKAVGFFADIVHGLEVVFKGVELVVKGFVGAVVSAFELAGTALSSFLDAVITNINTVIQGLNKIPNVDIATIDPFSDSAFMQGLHALGEAARNEVGDVRRELHELAMQEMPSEAVEKFLETVKQKSTEAAQAVAAVVTKSTENNSGVAGPESELDAIKSKYVTEQELLRAHKSEMMTIGDEFDSRRFDSEAEWQSVREQAIKGHVDKVNSLRESERSSAIGIVQSMGSSLMSLAQGRSKKAFELGKKAARASAVIKGGESAVSAWSAGMATGGPLAPAVAAAYTAASLAKTGMMIRNINSQSFSGGGSQPSVGGSGMPIAIPSGGEGVGGGGGSPAGESQSVALNIDPDAIITGRGIISMLEEAQKNGANLSFLGAT
jgi:hypothetical protein